MKSHFSTYCILDHCSGNLFRLCRQLCRFWQRAKVHAAKVTQERFIATWRTYLESVITQAERRGASYICTIDEYMDARRDNIGTRPSFAFMEICLGLNIPHEVMEHPALVTLERCATDLVLLGNVRISERRLYWLTHLSFKDILSYKWETLAAAGAAFRPRPGTWTVHRATSPPTRPPGVGRTMPRGGRRLPTLGAAMSR